MIGVAPIGAFPLSSDEADFGAIFSGSATLAGKSSIIVFGSSTFQGSAAVAAAGLRRRLGRATLVGAATLVGSGVRATVGAVAFGGFATLSGRLNTGISGAAEFTAAASLTVDVNLRIYAATREFITRTTDTPISQPFYGTLQKVIRFDRSILNGGRIGQVTAGWGEMELINAEADYDALIEKYAIDGRRIVLKVGIEGAAYNDFQILFDGTSADWHVDENVLRIQVRDNTYKLEVPAQSAIYAGTGGLEGTEDLKSKRKPLALGQLNNITPIDLIPTELVRQVSSGPIEAITAVYDKAVLLAPTIDYPNASALRAATTGLAGSGADIEAGEYATCIAEGLFRLGGANQGVVTCDAKGDATGGAYVDTTATIIRRLIGKATEVTDPTGLITSSFDRVDDEQPAVVGYWLGDEETVADVIANLMGAIGGWGGMRRDGRFEIGIFTPPDEQIAAYYDRVDIIDIERQKLPDGLSPPPWRFRTAWGRNWTVQTDVDGQEGVTPERVAFLREARRLVTSNEADGRRIKINHPLAQDPEPIESFFQEQAPAQAEADRQLAMFGPTSSLYRMRLKIKPFTHEIGRVVHVTYPRWDLVSGRALRIVSLGDDTDDDSVELIGFG
jgi:hypothetical protein